jgi:hypothetical protein
VSLVGQENGHVNLVEWPPSSASPATEGQQLGLLNASFSVASTWKSKFLVSVLLLEVFVEHHHLFCTALATPPADDMCWKGLAEPGKQKFLFPACSCGAAVRPRW